jgi:hypothetical protein
MLLRRELKQRGGMKRTTASLNFLSAEEVKWHEQQRPPDMQAGGG